MITCFMQSFFNCLMLATVPDDWTKLLWSCLADCWRFDLTILTIWRLSRSVSIGGHPLRGRELPAPVSLYLSIVSCTVLLGDQLLLQFLAQCVQRATLR